MLVLCLLIPVTGYLAEPTFTVEGVDNPIRASVADWLKRKAQSRDNWDAETARNQTEVFADIVSQALQPFGYYHAEARFEWTQSLHADVTIEPGTPVQVAEIDLEYTGDLAEDFSPPDFPMEVGDQLNHPEYEAARDQLVRSLIESGYVKTRLEHAQVLVDPEANTASVSLVVNPGLRAFFGDVTFVGGQLDESVLRRYVPFSAGDAFSYRKLIEFNRLLRDSRYFNQIEIDPDFADPTAVDVAVRLTPGQRTEFEAGVGFGTDSGLGVDTEYALRWVNDKGHRLSSRAELAQRRSLIGGSYEIPRGRDARTLWRVSASVTDENTDTADSQAARLNLSRFHTSLGMDRVDSLELLRERSEIAGVRQTTDLLMPGLQLQDISNETDPIPSEGYTYTLGVTGAIEGVLSDASFAQFEARGKWIHPLGSQSRIILRGGLGTTLTDDFDLLPASLRYFAGGDRSIRGYDFESLGPVNEDGEVIGGKHLIEASAEWERIIKGPWRAAAFVDTGAAFSDSADDLFTGAGIGVRYALPFGLIRIDIAAPLDGDDNKPRLHLVVGPDL